MDGLFHWGVAQLDNNTAAPGLGLVVRQLLIDVDPSLVPTWMVVTGFAAHVLFLVAFFWMIGTDVYQWQRKRVRLRAN